MKILLDVKDNKARFFLELLENIEGIRVLSKVNDIEKGQAIKGLVDAFQDVKDYEQGKKKLKTAQDVLDEL